jgi:hypothetical protein
MGRMKGTGIERLRLIDRLTAIAIDRGRHGMISYSKIIGISLATLRIGKAI